MALHAHAFGTGAAGEDQIDVTIANLKILGMLQTGGKRCVRRTQLAVDRESRLQGVRRWLSKDSRDVTLVHIRKTLNAAVGIASAILATHEGASAQAPHAAHAPGDLSAWTLARLIEEMRACESGLQILKASYADDSATVAALEVLADRLRAHCADLGARAAAVGGCSTART